MSIGGAKTNAILLQRREGKKEERRGGRMEEGREGERERHSEKHLLGLDSVCGRVSHDKSAT